MIRLLRPFLSIFLLLITFSLSAQTKIGKQDFYRKYGIFLKCIKMI